MRKYWWTRYGDLPAEIVRAAFQQALDTCEFFPSPAAFNAILRDIGAQSGAIVDGASAWDAMDRALFAAWSETNDRVNIRENGYPWPDGKDGLCRAILRGELGLTVRDVAEMHPAEYAKTRARFVERFDARRQVAQAEATVAKLAAPTPTPLPAERPRLRPVAGGES